MSAAALFHTIRTYDGPKNGRHIVTFHDHEKKNVFLRDLPQNERSTTVKTALHCHWKRVIPACCGTFSAATLEALRQSPHVKCIEEDPLAELCSNKETDPTLNITTQTDAPWGLQRISQRPPVPDKGDLELVYTWNYLTNVTSNPVDIYVLDTGVRTTHAEFNGRARWGKTFIGEDGVDNHGHGTHCAGIAAGKQCGIARDVGIVAVKVLPDEGSGGRGSDTISGLEWVVEDMQSTGRTAVVSMSLSFPPCDAIDDVVNNLVTAHGIHVVAAAGNQNKDARERTPARAAQAITVGASDIKDVRHPASNYGPAVTLFAPGMNIIAAGIEDDTSFTRGGRTSAATPHVAGLIAYWINVFTYVPPRVMKDILRGVATRNALSDLPPDTPNLLVHNDNDGEYFE